MATSKVMCAYCQEMFEKEDKRIRTTEREGKQHTCSRRCAARLGNVDRRSAPKTSMAESARKDHERRPTEYRARQLVRRAIKKGCIQAPPACQHCYAETELEAHHEDHIRPYFIIWLCGECHRFFDLHKLQGFCTDYSEQCNEKTD
jgi:hypothetical protein